MSMPMRCGRPRPRSVSNVRILEAMTALLFTRSMLMVFIMMKMLVMVVHCFGRKSRGLARPEFLPRHILLAVNVDVHLCGRNLAAHYPRDFQLRAHIYRYH